MSNIRNPVLEEKLGKLRDYYTSDEDVQLLNVYEKKLRNSVTSLGINKMAPIMEIVAQAEATVKDVSIILSEKRELSEKERDSLFVKRECYQFFIDRLSGKRDDHREKAIEDWMDTRIKIIEDKDS